MHNGNRRGFLYRIAEDVASEDVVPLPGSVMAPGIEWVTRRDLGLELIEPIEIREADLLSEAEIVSLQRQAAAQHRSNDT